MKNRMLKVHFQHSKSFPLLNSLTLSGNGISNTKSDTKVKKLVKPQTGRKGFSSFSFIILKPKSSILLSPIATAIFSEGINKKFLG